jgi:6-phosphogluconolactonase/glucosamine-6-phosphate isomerase/deaminase
MEFIQSKDGKEGVEKMAVRLAASLGENLRVLWLICGGSNIPLASEAMTQLRKSVSHEQLGLLTVGQTDERYGPIGHKDSNWKQMEDAQFNFDNVNPMPILLGESLEKTVEEYARRIKNAFEENDIVVAQFGIGADGHVAGMLPGCEAIDESALVGGYVAEPFVRVTLTPPAFEGIDIAYTFAFGDSKHEAVTRLWQKDLTVFEMPCQILKRIPESYFYSDQL